VLTGQGLLHEGQYLVITCRADEFELVVDQNQGIGQLLRLGLREKVGKPGLYLWLGEIQVFDLYGRAVPDLGVEFENARGLRRRPDGSSAAWLASLLAIFVPKHLNLD